MIAAARPGVTSPTSTTSTSPDTCGKLAFATTYAQFQADVAAYNAARDRDGRPLADDVPVSAGAPPGRLGVLGWPVFHSRSPAMQRAALDALGLHGWSYQHAAGAARALRGDRARAARRRASSAPT